MTFDGHYSDGRTAARHDVRIELLDDALVVHRSDGDPIARWAYDEIVLLDEPVVGTFRIGSTIAPDERLVVSSVEFGTALRARAPHLSTARRARRRRRFFVGALLALAPLVLIGAAWALQQAVRVVAPLVPVTWERPLGRYVRAELIEGHKVCNGASGRDALMKLVARLGAAADPAVRFDVEVVDFDVTNAFALPGGTIIVFDQLVRHAHSADELAGVLAHEMAHVLHRDPTQAVLRSVGWSLMVRSLFGGTPGAQLGSVLLQLANSRAAEDAADREALAILRRAGLRTDGLATFFERLEREHPSADLLPTILSTHPPTPARRAAIGTPDHHGATALERRAWNAVRRVCYR